MYETQGFHNNVNLNFRTIYSSNQMKKHLQIIAALTRSLHLFFLQSKAYVLLLTITFLLLFYVPSLPAQTLQKATSGTGQYKDDIWWLNFAGITLNTGNSLTQTYSVEGGAYSLVVTIDNITFSGTLLSGQPMSNQRLVGYVSGTWNGDGLRFLYNNGSPNTFCNALRALIPGNGTSTPAYCNFRVRAYAYTNPGNIPIDVGLVFANAEDDAVGEYSRATTNGSSWQLLETRFAGNTGLQSLIRSGSGQTMHTECGSGVVAGNGNVAMAYTKKLLTTAINPLNVDLTVCGIGRTAVAVGFFLTGKDRGDAPDSYGDAKNRFFSTAMGGNPGADGTYYITTAGTLGAPDSSRVHPVGWVGYGMVPRLGDAPGDTDPFTSIPGVSADADNLTGINDEDAMAALAPVSVGSGLANYSITVPATRDPGKTTYVKAWMDLNRNGIFDVSEAQATTLVSDANVNFTWALPSGFTDNSGETYIRVRIHTDPVGLALGAYDETFGGGETEDHILAIVQLLPVNLLYFKASEQAGSTLLQWATSAEKNNKGFEVQRSADGRDWQTIGHVNSLARDGNSNTALYYTYIDGQPANGINYYQLKQTDLDGKHEYSSFRKLNFSKTVAVQLYPNPVQNRLQVQGLKGINKINIVDNRGRIVQSNKTVNVVETSLNVSALTKGTYLVVITNEDGTAGTYKIIKE